MQSSFSRLPLALPLLAVIASAGPCRAAEPNDPLEGVNRRSYQLEEVLDHVLIGPAAHAFGRIPSPIRGGLRNFSRNLGEPVVAVNDLLQGRIKQAARTVARLVVNSTFGLGGILDVANSNHLPHHDNGFGTTLGRWGAGPGPYLFIPLLGPSTVRDAFGRVADIGLNPLTYARFRSRTEIDIGIAVVDGLGARLDADQELENIRQTSTDPYATLRSYYLQHRQAQILGNEADIEALPDFDTPGAPPAGRAPQPPPTGATPPLPSEAATPPRPDDAPAAPKPDTGDKPESPQAPS
jgi:phospholipid-binding lipoprotein MlaA